MSRHTFSVRRILACTLAGVITAGLTLTNVQFAHAATSTPAFLSFESNDYNGAQLASLAGSTKPIGFWNGATATIADNPSPKTGKGLKFIKSKAGDPWSGMTAFDGARYGDSSNKALTFDVYSEVATTVPIEIKLEKLGGGNPAAGATAVCVGAAQGWNSLTVDLSTAKNYSSSATYGRVVIIPDFKDDCIVASNYGSVVTKNDQAFYFDNISVNGGTSANVCVDSNCTAPSSPASPMFMNFEDTDLGGAAVTVNGAFGGGVVAIAAAPSGNNGKSLQFTKTSGGDPAFDYSGVNLYVDVDDARITDATHKTIKFDYYSPDSAAVTVQIQRGSASLGNQVISKVVLSVSTGWNSLTADLSTDTAWSSTTEYYSLVIYPDYDGTSSPVARTGQKYYIDNVSVNGGTVANIDKVGPSASPTATPTATATSTPTATPTATPSKFPDTVPTVAKSYDHANIRLTSPSFNDTNSVNEDANFYGHVDGDGNHARIAYFNKGATINLTYHVDRGAVGVTGTALSGVKVYLIVNKAYSCSNATFSTSTYAIAADFCGEDAGGTAPGRGQSVLTGTTNSSGDVTFTLTNTNTTGEVRPPALNVENPNALYNSGNEVKSNFYPTLGGLAGAESIDNLWPHFLVPAGLTANSITWTAPTTGAAKSAAITLTATSKQGSVSYVSTTLTKCTVDGNKLSLLAAGSCSVTASANGNSTYAAAAPVTKVITVTAAANKITWTAPTKATFGNAPLTLTATSNQGSVQYSSSTTSICTVSGSAVTFKGAGACKLTANSAADSAYVAATAVAKTITVAKGVNPITVTAPALSGASVSVGKTITVTASAPGGAVAITAASSTVCTISNGVLTGKKAGSCTLTFNQASSTNYLAATKVTVVVTVKA